VAADAFAGFPLVPPSTPGGVRAHTEHVQNGAGVGRGVVAAGSTMMALDSA
jgi:hypothetical protein